MAVAAIRARAAKLLRDWRKRLARGITRVRAFQEEAQRALDAIVAAIERPLRSTARVPGKVAEAAASYRELFAYSPPGEAHRCPACGASPVTLLEPLPLTRRGHGQRVGFVSGCTRCGLVFANPLPSQEELEVFYSPEGDWGRPRRDQGQSAKVAPVRYLRELLRPAESWLDVTRPRAGSRVLDVGCGNGELLDAFQDLGWETFGIEPAERSAFRRHRELTEIPADASFDAVVLHHVLEHVASPLDLLRAVHAALRDRGVVIISVPRLDMLPVHGDKRYCINSRTHILSYTRDCLATLLSLCGFGWLDVSPPIHAPTRKARILRRQQILGVKGLDTGRPPAHPFAAARRAFSSYRAVTVTGRRRYDDWLPVRARAARLNRARIEAAASGRPRRRTAI